MLLIIKYMFETNNDGFV